MKDKIIICPNEEKIKILNSFNNDSYLSSVKFMTKEEYINNYYFSYKEDAIFYLMKKYGFHIDVCKIYLKNLYAIDISKNYKSDKLVFLQSLKKELIDNNLLIFNKTFRKYISNKEISVINYYDLDKYEEEALSYKNNIEFTKINSSIYEFNTMEDEINYVCIKICSLIKDGIDINNIYLTNVSSDYLFTIKKLFSYYNIPINIDFKDSIYNTKVVKDYLESRKVDFSDSNKNLINKKLINILSDLSFLDVNDPIYDKILIDRLKNTYLPSKKMSNAVNIKDFYKSSFSSDDYVFVIGFNQDILPIMDKDISFINDSIKDEVSLYTTSYLNNRRANITTYLLSKIDNLFLSYKLSTPFNSFHKSSLIDDLKLNIIFSDSDCYSYSDFYNMIRLAEGYDNYYLYGDIDNNLRLLGNHYNISYNTYSNKFSSISLDLYHKNLDYPLKLSYTSLNAYNECSFKYYIKYVLKLDTFVDSFEAFIGSLYHKILSLYTKSNFSFEEEFNKYLETRELSLKEKLLLVRIKKDLLEFIDVLKKQQLITGYDNFLFEKKAEVDLGKDISVVFVGYIDKIMYYKKIEDVYFSIIDYKSGMIDTNIEAMKYGLHMQLPIYLYLLHYSNVFTNPIFTGIYYQNILFSYPSWSLKLEKELNDRYLLKGYSTDDISILEVFDSTYTNSNYIKSMKYDSTKGFGAYTKLLSNDTLYNLITYTKDLISKKTDDILACKFPINPKIYNSKNVSCEFCSFKDLCFVRESDYVYLKRVDDLSFLGGK